MRKRVSLAAALINEPSVLLMDEPFGALDVQTKAIMSNELLGLWEQARPWVIFVTHDLEEAIALADQVVVMTAGPGTVKAVYDIDLPRPARRGAGDPVRAPLPASCTTRSGRRCAKRSRRTRAGRARRWRTVMSRPARADSSTAGPATAGAAMARPQTRAAAARGSGPPARDAGRRRRRLAAAHRRQGRRPVLLGQAQRDRDASWGTGCGTGPRTGRSGCRSGPR